ncbi:hypothetical protein [Nostoc sp.]|uniref:hypothetical protein n=1 Tax=Nostoc sp. TaxID=1180 RepID=UPI002FFBC006
MTQNITFWEKTHLTLSAALLIRCMNLVIQYFLGFLLDEVNADIDIKQVSHLEVLSGVKEWLISRIHEVIGEIV